MIDQEKFNELLLAAYNIGPDAEPGDKQGADFNEAALVTSQLLFALMGRSPAYETGVIVAANLLTEVTSAKNPTRYMCGEIAKGFAGTRHERDGAGISRPPLESRV